MKQLTIYCSEELVSEVTQLFHKYEIESFIHVPGIYGTRLKPRDSLEQDLTWRATAFVVFVAEKTLGGIVHDLQSFANKCEFIPCLRMVVVPVEQIY